MPHRPNAEPALLLAGQTRAELIHKFSAAPSPRLAGLWSHFLCLARHNPHWLSTYSVLAWLVTEEEPYREIARDHFLGIARGTDIGLISDEVQSHTHTATAPLTHTMLLYDWVHGTGLLDPTEEAFFADRMLDFTCQSALVQLQGRARGFDNQILANAIGAAITGFVLGRRHGMSGRARRLYTSGHQWLIDQMGRLPADCYSLEGSTYHELIVMPLITFAAAFLEEVDGTPVYAKGINGGTPVRDWLTTYEMMIGESGLMPGWDQYGVMHAAVKLPLAYRSRRDHCPGPLAKILSANMWYPICHSTWEMVDRLWALVWWDDSLSLPPVAIQKDWMNERIGGALHESRTRTRLFQYWDETPGAPYCGRSQVNPNALQFEVAGLPLLFDGAPALDSTYLNWDLPVMRDYLGETMLTALAKSWGLSLNDETVGRQVERAIAGNVGESISLVFDDEDWYVPLRAVRGTGRSLRGVASLKLIESDAVDYYADRYDVSRCTRTSLLVDGSYAVVIDRVASATPHQLTWQAFTWPGAVLRDGGAIASAAGAVRLDVLAPANATTSLTDIEGFPLHPCAASTRVRIALDTPTREATFPVCLYAQETLDQGTDISAGWTHSREGASPAAGVDLERFYLSNDSPTGTRHQFCREVTCSAEELAAGMCLRLNNGGPTTCLTVNGVAVDPAFAQTSAEVKGKGFNIPFLYDLTAQLRAGVNELCFTTETFHGEVLKGPILLQSQRAAHVPEFAQTDDASFRVRTPDGWDHIHLGSGTPETWQGGTLRVAAALKRESGETCLLGVQAAEFPEDDLRVSASQPFDLAVKGSQIRLGHLSAGTSAVIRLRGSLIQVEASVGVTVAAVATEPFTLTLDLPPGTECVINGKTFAATESVMSVELPVSVSRAVTEDPSPEELYRYVEAPDSRLPSVVRNALSSPAWRVQVAGADIAGRFAMAAVVPELLDLFAAEGKEMPYPRLITHWDRSKMNNSLNPGVDHTPDPALDPVRDAKRYRLRQAIIIALGRIADPRALPALRAAMQAGTDHFLALAQVPVALARLEDQEAIPVLTDNLSFFEVNVRKHVELALAFLNGEITRSELEQRANPVI